MSRFVSGGTVDKPTERDDEWLKAQETIEAARRKKEDEARQHGGKSLYEVLQANKDAKQEAFEEAAKLKNQFRSLDQDEVEFLDTVMESTRAKEEAVKRETAERLEAFRRQQEDTEKASRGDAPEASNQSEADTWAFNARKRKRTRDKEAIAGLKLRKSSSSMAQMTSDAGPAEAVSDDQIPSLSSPAPTPANQPVKSVQLPVAGAPATAAASSAPAPAAALGLAAYSSDDDD
ncbi:hypothetical protein M436DRAFT_45896 [Aureobasidium namibiae CBS 147.97]|uniref:FAM192A/Fyv6 N-terminal domain-containing protein n=1 Tax=Aureobasidium namibiae CBS 147.97 TaxID=1043004 RepID=A0A074WKJ3_9PEZI|nr:uncharacterized protein M436DRAFT_45896 [Aureobasidium namibiae CBS 147.97]KEQ73630.1 hypothetical protein M436DRAFT_45896 [Aureobasidium namibiae CBS 147.97]